MRSIRPVDERRVLIRLSPMVGLLYPERIVGRNGNIASSYNAGINPDSLGSSMFIYWNKSTSYEFKLLKFNKSESLTRHDPKYTEPIIPLGNDIA